MDTISKNMVGEAPYFYLNNFSKVVRNPETISVFLDLAKSERKHISEIKDDLGIDTFELIPLLKLLHESGFIEENPHQQFDKVLKLTFSGKLFAEQLKRGFPQVQEVLGKESKIVLDMKRDLM